MAAGLVCLDVTLQTLVCPTSFIAVPPSVLVKRASNGSGHCPSVHVRRASKGSMFLGLYAGVLPNVVPAVPPSVLVRRAGNG